MRSTNRYLILTAALAMQACLGATYSWSIFAQALQQHGGLARAQLPFTLFYIAFPATMIGTGLFMRKLGPRGCAVLGGVLFGTGWMVASLGTHGFGFTMLGVGILGGIGVGIAYVIPISAGMQWFPNNKGLVTGLIVAGFGGGAALVAQIAQRLMGVGWSPFEVLRTLGICFAVIVTLSGLLIRYPSRPTAQAADDTPRIAPRDLLRDPMFRALYVAMFAGLAAGFAVNTNLRQLFPDIGPEAGVMAVGIFALSNAAGRICWGWSFDSFLSMSAIPVNLFAQAVLLLCAPLLITSATGVQILAAVAGFNYGGVLVLYASASAHKWGAKRLGPVYGLLFSANIPASFAPVLAAASSERAGSFTPALLAIGVILIAAIGIWPLLVSKSNLTVPAVEKSAS